MSQHERPWFKPYVPGEGFRKSADEFEALSRDVTQLRSQILAVLIYLERESAVHNPLNLKVLKAFLAGPFAPASHAQIAHQHFHELLAIEEMRLRNAESTS